MPAPTIAFSLISFADIKAANFFSSNAIPRSKLTDMVLFVKTSAGGYAKMHVQAGDSLYINELTAYNATGCIIKTATNLVIANNAFCDIDKAIQTNTNADFQWHAIANGTELLPKNGAEFAFFINFDAISFNDVSAAPYKNQRIAREWLGFQTIYCKTSQGRYAKLRVEAGNDLMVRRLVVYNNDGTQFLSKSNIKVPQTWTLDLDTGNVGAAGYDLWWEAVNATTFFLVPTNGAAISFESYYQYEKYFPLLTYNPVKNAMIISGSSDRAYGLWTAEEQLQLREFIFLLETNKPLPITGPPILTNGFMKDCEAIKIYMAHLAQSLWVDANNKVIWKLTTAGTNTLTHLFDMRKLFNFVSGAGYQFSWNVMGKATHWNPVLSYNFLKDNNFILGDHWSTIKAVVGWCRANLVHIWGYTSTGEGGPFATQEDQWEYLFGYRGYPPVDKMINPLPGKNHTTHGCWGTDAFLASVLRTVNIPLQHGRSNFSGDFHSRAEFFTVGKNLRHGDDPYNGWVRLGVNNVPVEKIFLTDAELNSLIDNPPPLPGKTIAETASFNHGKIYAQLAVQYKTNYLLKLRCADKQSGISTGAGSQVWEELHEYYTDAQLTTIIAECDTAIAAIPGGCSSI